MKLWLYAMGMCQSMFCALPFPWHGWEEKARDKMLLCLPVVGLEIGLLWWAAGWLCLFLGLPDLIRGFVLCALSCFLTGGMHLDGFLDVTDAVRSCRSLERRREILKDSHVGSFAVLGAVLLLLGQFAATASFEPGMDLRGLILIPVVSRCCSVLAILILPPMTTSQYAGMQKKPMVLPVLMLIAALCGGFLFGWKCGLVLVCTLLGACIAVQQGYRSLQGMNGDISGYAITLAELAGLMAMAIAQ